MIKDKARKWTEKKLKSVEKKLEKTYKTATKEITKDWNAYMERGKKRLEALYDDFKNAPIEIQGEAEKRYKEALNNYTLRNKSYKQMVETTTERLANVNQEALAYVNGSIPMIYKQNFNSLKDDAQKAGIKFNIVSEDVIRRRILDGNIKLPPKKIDIPKDMKWNTKKLNSAVMQGILQGESMDEIAKRILPVVDNNKDASIRNARTMVTGAENSGRLDGYKRLKREGAILKKVWIATADDRTRESHLFLDGQERELDEPFIDGDGNELQYPGDADAVPETVYNCRCSMATHIVGIITDDGVTKIDIEPESSLHEEQIAEEKEKRNE